MTEEHLHLRLRPVSPARLWFDGLAPPLAWAVQLNVAYLIVVWECLAGVIAVNALLFLVSAAALAVNVVAGVLSYGAWRYTGVGDNTDLGGPPGRGGAIAIFNVAQSVVFGIAIVLTGISQVMVPICG